MAIAPEYEDNILGSGRYCVYQAAKKGHKASQIFLMNEAARKGNHSITFRWAQQIYESGDKSSIMILANCYRYGLGVTSSRRRAKKLYQEAAAAGNEEAKKILEEL